MAHAKALSNKFLWRLHDTHAVLLGRKELLRYTSYTGLDYSLFVFFSGLHSQSHRNPILSLSYHQLLKVVTLLRVMEQAQ